MTKIKCDVCGKEKEFRTGLSIMHEDGRYSDAVKFERPIYVCPDCRKTVVIEKIYQIAISRAMEQWKE